MHCTRNTQYHPQTGYDADLAAMAAALFESLIMNHPFIDGNKPVAFFATDVFLRLNGYKLKVDARKAHRFLIGLLENDRCNFDKLLPWIRKHAVKL
jgi:death-on-curing protein